MPRQRQSRNKKLTMKRVKFATPLLTDTQNQPTTTTVQDPQRQCVFAACDNLIEPPYTILLCEHCCTVLKNDSDEREERKVNASRIKVFDAMIDESNEDRIKENRLRFFDNMVMIMEEDETMTSSNLINTMKYLANKYEIRDRIDIQLLEKMKIKTTRNHHVQFLDMMISAAEQSPDKAFTIPIYANPNPNDVDVDFINTVMNVVDSKANGEKDAGEDIRRIAKAYDYSGSSSDEDTFKNEDTELDVYNYDNLVREITNKRKNSESVNSTLKRRHTVATTTSKRPISNKVGFVGNGKLFKARKRLGVYDFLDDSGQESDDESGDIATNKACDKFMDNHEKYATMKPGFKNRDRYDDMTMEFKALKLNEKAENSDSGPTTTDTKAKANRPTTLTFNEYYKEREERDGDKNPPPPGGLDSISDAFWKIQTKSESDKPCRSEFFKYTSGTDSLVDTFWNAKEVKESEVYNKQPKGPGVFGESWNVEDGGFGKSTETKNWKNSEFYKWSFPKFVTPRMPKIEITTPTTNTTTTAWRSVPAPTAPSIMESEPTKLLGGFFF